MENCTIYSHYLAFDKVVEILKREIPKAKFEVLNNDQQKSLTATISGGLLGRSKTLKVNYRQRANPSYKLDHVECALTQNLSGMVGYIQKIDAIDKPLQNKLLYKVMAANAEMPFMAEPDIAPEFESALKKILVELDAFVFTTPNKVFNRSGGPYFADKRMAVILDGMGASEATDLEVSVDSRYHDQPAHEYTKEQLDRKTESEIFLKEKGIKVNQNLPCVESSEGVTIRTVKEVVDRVYALVTVAAKGEGVEQSNLDRVIADKKINSFSPTEHTVIFASELTDQQRAYATWRYESLYVMLWALGKTDLKYPSEICDVPALVGSVIRISREDFEKSVALRSEIEILDQLDKIYRMNWACVDARLKGQDVGGNIHAGIVYERHYSLNWLTCYQDQDWDDVDTNT